jgi:hypothetical protein
MGINGAFLTGDLFNLFVFFEILLIASYALLVHGGGREKTKAGFQYVTLNLIGSALFLVALGTLYGTVGSLNMADMAFRVGQLLPEDQTLAKTGGLLLLLVFSLKSALLPLHFWLPKTYGAASASVVALFAVMTKVGFYSICRVFAGIFGNDAGALANLATPWIWPLGHRHHRDRKCGCLCRDLPAVDNGEHGHCFCWNAAACLCDGRRAVPVRRFLLYAAFHPRHRRVVSDRRSDRKAAGDRHG